ncbi:MAG: ATP-binding cassette domain-containing protein, partial [Sphingomonas bacterium]|nr:ATP-binding cassette domain-containing protein [Sphingomonas bacterium]
RMTSARTESSFLAVAPRYLVEAVGLIVFTLLAIRLASGSGSVTAALPVLGALALGAQRMLPLVQQLYQGWAALASSRSIVGQLFDLLGLPVDDSATGQAIEFRSEIRFAQVGFSFPTRAVPALSAIDLVIPHGARIAIVGRTGAGKTTLTDLLMGLMPPQTGTISIDGAALTPHSARAWQRKIAHVPQSIFLADASIARNIAFASAAGADNPERLRRAASIAQIDAFIAGLPDGYDTRIGERGVRLSGGQRQRLGLARAIYKQAPVLVLDEATSALDDATEEAVLDALGQLQATGCTIIIVAHRASTIKSCDRILRLEDGRIVSDEANERS